MEAQFGKQLYMRAASHVLSKNNSDSDSFVDYAVQRIHVVLLALCALFSNLLATVVGRSRPLIQFELAVATFLGALRSRYEPDSTAKHEGACYSSDESLRNLRSTEALQSVCVMCSHSLAPFEFMDSVDLLSERLNGDHELQVLNIYSAEAFRARQREREREQALQSHQQQQQFSVVDLPRRSHKQRAKHPMVRIPNGRNFQPKLLPLKPKGQKAATPCTFNPTTLEP